MVFFYCCDKYNFNLYSGVYYEYFSDEYPIPDMDKNNDLIIDKEYFYKCEKYNYLGYKTESTPEYYF